MHMAEYQHLEFVGRRGTNSMKWDYMESMFGRDDLLAAWVADMDIESPACVRDTLRAYVDVNVFGYYRASEGYHDAFIAWERDQHGYDVRREWVRHVPGVVPGLYWAVQAYTESGAAVATMPPVYYPFASAVRETGRNLIEVPLLNHEGRYSMDLEGFERAVVEHDVKLLILCSPHNPVGRVWTAGELRALLDICRERGVIVVSDEIHHDLIMPGHEHVVAANVGDYDGILVIMMSASKTFNLAACAQSFAVIADERLRRRFDAFAQGLGLTFGNPFGYLAYEAAYREGLPWLQDVLHLVWDNYQLLVGGLGEELPQAKVTPLEGTYLAWIDLASCLEGRDAESVVKDVCKLAVDFGSWFGGVGHESYVRVNLATSPDTMRKIVQRLSLLR